MQAEFRAPRRRIRVYEDYEAPLPVSQTPEERTVYRADLINQQVVVRDPHHIQMIHNKGFFGKGVLSRSRPDHSISDQWEQHEGLHLPVLSHSRYEELLRWATASLSAQGLDEEAVNQALLVLTQPMKIEDVRSEGGGGVAKGENRRKELDEEAGPVAKRPRAESEVKPVAKRRCRLDQQDPDPSSDSDPGPDSGSDQHSDSDPGPDSGSDQHSDSDPGPDSGSDQHSDSDPGPDSGSDQHSDSDPGPGLHVPGPGFVLLVSDSPEGGGVTQVRRSPLFLSEYLQLSLEEAFFLVYSLGVLSVYLHQEPLSVIELWRKFRSLRPDFVGSYAAYHHFRSVGWVPKVGGGAKYGVDFMLYRKGPPFYHSSYSVVVEQTDETFRGAALRPFSWRSLAALSRITGSVSKELMLCYIICPADLSEAELDSPVCLSRLEVQEVIVSRWVSSKERAEQDDI